MGNDQSHLGGIEIEEKSVEVSDFWSHHQATFPSDTVATLSVLIGELFVDGSLWKNQTPLEKNSKHLMIYRHPCILKYISSWNKSSKFYLAVEEVTPLSQVLGVQNTLQICIGLHSVLKALCFLHEKALVSHNNICIASIYVTKEGGWRLGGMEYLCKFNELTHEYLKKAKNSRYTKAIDPNEDQHLQGGSKDFVDIFAYSVLVSEVLKGNQDDEVPGLTAFREFCKEELQQISIEHRPKLSTLLDHEFFNHEFIAIHSFLCELPLKSDEEKSQFFHCLLGRLRAFPEATVGAQFGNLLLSRLVLLNKTAQEEVLPAILGDFFSEDTFKKHLVPKLLDIFAVRDIQIRLYLLSRFSHFVKAFTHDQLQSIILPELLVGVKDTDDLLVAATLRTLSDLVPILGAATVIGGKRAKLFNDGRPTTAPLRRSLRKAPKPPLPERPRPDGEEGETSAEEAEVVIEEELDNWEDWGEVMESSSESAPTVVERREEIVGIKRNLPDISELDIKSQATGRGEEEIDFFQDMEPVIVAASKFVVEEEKAVKNKLTVEDEGNEDGWGDEEWE